MSYAIVLPHDTQTEINEFIENRYVGLAASMAAIDVLEREMDNLAANPTLGVVPRGTPFESRRLHRFVITVGDRPRTVEFTYRMNAKEQAIVLSGFREFLPRCCRAIS